jgi:transposase
MYETLDDTAAQIILATERGDSIRRVAQRLHTPYETVRQAVNRLEDGATSAMPMASPWSTSA